jgi:hypothetical protein
VYNLSNGIHSYWVGSSQMPQPLYQYRFILTEDENLLNVATDMDFNIEGEVKAGITPNISTKLNFVVMLNNYNNSNNIYEDIGKFEICGHGSKC